MRGEIEVMINRLFRFSYICIGPEFMAGVRVSIEAREIAAGYFDPYLMPF
jgi:hypothetical protein